MNKQLTPLFACIDHTSLAGDDNRASIARLCQQAIDFQSPTLPHVAAVCVYPDHARQAAEMLQGTGIKVASVAGGFPHGQTELLIKKLEAQYALSTGADEIDMVLSRGLFLEGNYSACYEEILAMKKVCGDKHLKVILETGELREPELIYRASMLAMEAGADFIKTSTGKIAQGATLEAAAEMLKAIKEFHKISKNGSVSRPLEVFQPPRRPWPTTIWLSKPMARN